MEEKEEEKTEDTLKGCRGFRVVCILALDRLSTGRPLQTDLAPSGCIAVAAQPPVHGWTLVCTEPCAARNALISLSCFEFDLL